MARAGPSMRATSVGTPSRHAPSAPDTLLSELKLLMSPPTKSLISIPCEHGQRGREAVEEVAAADGADLAGAEEARRGNAQRVLDRGRIVVGQVEHVRAAAVAGEQQGAGRTRRAKGERLSPQGLAEVLVGGGPVADVHPHRLADTDLLADG